jgi:HK97 family phage portal protein
MRLPLLRGKALRIFDRGRAVTVTPGDPLWDRLAPDFDTPLTRSTAYTRHWAVRACVELVARGLDALDSTDVAQAGDGFVPVRQPRIAPMLVPHAYDMARDLCVYGESIYLRARDDEKRTQALVRVADPNAVERDGKGYQIGDDKYTPDEVFHVKIPAMDDRHAAASPVDPLLALLNEDIAAGAWRLMAWKGFTPGSIVERPIEAPELSDNARTRVEAALKGMKAADVAILEEGMTPGEVPLPDSQSAEYLSSRRFVAEAVCSVYGVPSVLIGTGENRQLDPASRQLLRQGIAPLAKRIEQAAAEQLGPDAYGPVQAAGGRMRPHYDIDEADRKAEPAEYTKAATGSVPWRTRNEQRRLEGLAPIDGGDVLPDPPRRVVVE